MSKLHVVLVDYLCFENNKGEMEFRWPLNKAIKQGYVGI